MGIALIPEIDYLVNYYANAEGGSENGCAQAAVATMIHYWDRYEVCAGKESDALVRAVYRAHPPDTPFAWFGSTPGHLQNIFRALRFRSWRRSGAEHAEADLKRSVRAGAPMVAMVDMGKFDPVDKGVLHYVVVYGYDDQYVHVRNMIPEEIERIEWKLFLSAWHCWFMNQLPNPFAGVGDWQFSGIVVAMNQETIARASSRKARLIITPAESSEMLGSALGFLQPSPRLARESARLAKKQRPLRRSRAAAVPGRPRGAAALEKTLNAVREAGGTVTLDGRDVTTTVDAAASLAALPRDLLAQLRKKLADSVGEAHHRREIARIGIQQAGEPAKLQFTANIDTAGEWVDIDWQG